MPTVLITGANRGLGLEFVRQYVIEGWQVLATVREPAKATELQAFGDAVEIHALDVADFGSSARLAATLGGRALDVLINNAGVYGGRAQSMARGIDGEDWLQTFRINTVAPIKLTEALLPNLRAGQEKKAVFITSQMGSIADNSSGGYYAYRASKAALNAAVKSLAVDTAPEGIIAVVLHPGWVKTDMGGPNAPLEPRTSITGMRRVIAGLKQRDSGTFLGYDGRRLPW